MVGENTKCTLFLGPLSPLSLWWLSCSYGGRLVLENRLFISPVLEPPPSVAHAHTMQVRENVVGLRCFSMQVLVYFMHKVLSRTLFRPIHVCIFDMPLKVPLTTGMPQRGPAHSPYCYSQQVFRKALFVQYPVCDANKLLSLSLSTEACFRPSCLQSFAATHS